MVWLNPHFCVGAWVMTDSKKNPSMSLLEEAHELTEFYSTAKPQSQGETPVTPLPEVGETSGTLQLQYRVMAVGDEARNRKILDEALTPFGFRIRFIAEADAALHVLGRQRQDLIVVHTQLPEMSGYDFCRATKQNPRLTHIPLILMKARATLDDKLRGYHVGTDEFLMLPMPDAELRARMRALVRIRMHYQRLSNNVRQLEFRLKNREKELEDINLGLIAALEKANEMNDSDTGNHIRRVCHLSRMLAKAADLPPSLIRSIFRNASLHDVGKVATPDAILKKEGKLTESEMHEMKRHTLYGFRLLKEARADEVACNIALSHHEKWDGSGYPRELKAQDIPVEARIVALADVFDALISRRCYKEPLPVDNAIEHIQQSAGAHFDPKFVDLFVKNLPEVHKIRSLFSEEAQAALH